MMVDIEELLSKPYWIVDILPKQVPANAGGQYFTIEKYFLSPPHIDAIYRKFANMMLKLNCYDDIKVFQVDGETCVELNKYEDGPTFDGINRPRVTPEQPERPVKPEKPAKPEKKSRWKAWGDKLSRLMTEDEAGDDDQ